MPNKNDEYAPDLSKLDGTYQLLTELRRSSVSRTYLARQTATNRDVTITVTHAPATGSNELAHLASDARLLGTMTHPNVVPVIEGRWLGARSFAVVRERVNGSTLDQLLSAVGPLPPARVASVLGQIHAAIVWARDNGILHRDVPLSAVAFQPDGNVRVAFEQSPLVENALPGEADDARTIGVLATQMLTGRAAIDDSRPLVAQRPDLPPAIAEQIDRLRHSRRGQKTLDAGAVIAALAGAGGPADTAALATPLPAPMPMPTAPDESVVVVRHGAGYNARLVTALVALLIVAAAAVLLLRNRGTETQTVATTPAPDTTQGATGEVTLGARPDTSMYANGAVPVAPTVVGTIPQQVPSQVPAQVPPSAYPPSAYPPAAAPAYPPAGYPAASPAAGYAYPDSTTRMSPPTTRRSEPLRQVPPPVSAPAPVTTTPPTDVAPPPPASDASGICASPGSSEQHACLMQAIERNDVTLNQVYNQLIGALRQQANAQPGDDDPPSVRQLRNEERDWVDRRDAACRDVGSPPLYAQARAQCFADQSNQRLQALRQMLAGIR